MATKAVVKYWSKNYGFAEAASGEVVHIHATQVRKNRLKPGASIFCDMEDAKGHDGRKKGINVTGPGVVPLTDKPTDEERREAQEMWTKFKAERISVKGAEPPKRLARKAGEAKTKAAPPKKGTTPSEAKPKGKSKKNKIKEATKATKE